MTGRVVLVLSEDGDWSADAVTAELDGRGVAWFRFDTAEFPQRMALTAALDGSRSWTGRISTARGELALDEVGAVFYRRPRAFELPVEMSEPERRFARAQARVGLGGILASLEARWMSHPFALADAEYKPRQLDMAVRCGLTPPPTMITNEPGEVRRFAEQYAPLVVKALSDPLLHERGRTSAVYTHLLTAADLGDLSGVETTAHLFQAFVPKAFEVRLTVVGDRLFPVAIHAGSPEARIDWRRDYDALSYEVIGCPTHIAAGVRAYLTAYGLRYGAFDFVVTPNGEWVWIECNAAGQWGWLGEACGLPIAAAFADELTAGWCR